MLAASFAILLSAIAPVESVGIKPISSETELVLLDEMDDLEEMESESDEIVFDDSILENIESELSEAIEQ